jgi:putative MFS transporter
MHGADDWAARFPSLLIVVNGDESGRGCAAACGTIGAVTASAELLTERITPLHIMAGAACALALAIDMVEMAIGNVLATVFSMPGKLGDGHLPLMLASVYVGAVVGAPIIGWLSDRRGIRICLAGSLVWLAVTSSLAGASATVSELSVYRLLSGFALGAIPPLLIAYLTQIAPARYRGAFIFWVCGSASLVPPFALLSIRWVIHEQPLGVEGWRWPLYVASILAVAASCAFLYLPEFRSSRTRAVATADEGTDDSPRSRISGRFAFVAGIYFLLPWASAGFPLLTGPILLREGYDLNQALLYVTLAAVGPSIGSFVTTSFVDKFDRRAVLGACALVMIGAVALFASSRAPGALGAALIVFGIATAIYVTALTLYAAELFPSEIRTFATSSAWAINRAASAVAPIVLFSLVGTQGVIISMLPICVALGLSVLLIAVHGPNGAARRVLA